jgi:hypothetical protein
MSAIISLSSGEARADLILQYGQGTDNPTVLLINHSGEAQIELGDVQRFKDEERIVSEKPSATLPQSKTVVTVEARPI